MKVIWFVWIKGRSRNERKKERKR